MRLLLILAASAATMSTAYAGMGMSFDWGPTTKCFDPKSPPIALSGVPQGTASLQFSMTDLDAPNFVHGGGAVAYVGQGALPYGAFRYKGPCPPQQHSYRLTVKALDASGRILATAKAERRFP